MKRVLVPAAIAAVALMGTSCTTAGSGDIFPMSVGSVWNMNILVMAGATAASLDTFETGTVVNTVVEKANLTTGPEVVKYKNEATIHRRTPDSTYSSTTYSYYREDGDWILGYSALDDSTGDTMMATTPTAGKTWHQGTSIAEVIGQEDVSVPAGTYKNAWKVKLTSSQGGYNVDMFSWFAPGTGLVKFHYESSNQGYSQVYDQELTSTTVK